MLKNMLKRGENKPQSSPLTGKGQSIDIPLAAVSVVLSVLGLVFIFSASSYSANVQLGDAFHYVKTQAVALALGLFAMLGLSFVNVSKIKKATIPLYLIGLVLLGMVFLPVIGVESYGAKRWINLGFFTIQPSEYAKFFMVMMLALIASKTDMSKFRGVIAVLLAGGAVCALLIIEPNMSITMCAVAVIFIMLFSSGARIKHLIFLIIPVIVGAVVLILVEPYRMQRLLAFLDPWKSPLEEGYQLIQSYYALGSGGLFGVGLFNSRQKYLFLPFAESDFILSVIGEETGLVGVAIIMSLFVVIAVRGVKIAKQASDRYSCYLAIGITAVTTVQALLNAAVVCGAIPPTGLQSIARNRLPFARINTFEANEARAEGIKHAKRKFSIR